MRGNWTKLLEDLGCGAVVGAADQAAQRKDDDRAYEKSLSSDKLDLASQYGTWLNYGVPVVGVLAYAMGWLPKGDWETRILTSMGQLAGRKLTWRYTEEKYSVGYPNYVVGTNPYMANANPYANANAAAMVEAQRRAALEQARGRVSQTEPTIPVVPGNEILA